MAITKNIIPVSVEDRFIAVSDHTQITAGNVGVDFLAVTLDAEWDGLNTYVTFSGCAQDSTTLDYAAELEVPWEQVEEAGDLYIGVQGFDPSADVTIDAEGQLVTNGVVPVLNAMAMTVPIKVRDSGAASGVAPSEPTPGTLQRVEQDLLALEKLTAGADQTIARVEAAASSAETAASSANTAASAANSAAEAATTAKDATEAATSAANSAAQAANDAAASVDASKTEALNAADRANTAASQADTARDAAQAVADNVESYMTRAEAAATGAEASKAAASASETAAAASASTASAKADAAASSESAAAASANSASASKDAAAASEANAAASEAAAKAAADKAESIAGFTVDAEVTQNSTNPVASKGVYNYVTQMFADFTAVTFEIVDSYAALPSTGAAGTFYFVPASSTGTSDLYSEYVWVNGAYEKFGDIQLPDLSPYAKMTWVTEQLSTQLASYYTKTEADGLLAAKQDALTIDAVPTSGSANPVQSGGVHSALATKADAATVTALSGTVNALSGTVAGKQDTLTFDSTPTAGSSNPVTSAGVKEYVDSQSANVEYLSNADFLALLGA